MSDEDWHFPEGRFLAYVLAPPNPSGEPLLLVFNATAGRDRSHAAVLARCRALEPRARHRDRPGARRGRRGSRRTPRSRRSPPRSWRSRASHERRASRFGPLITPDGVTFRLWAPGAKRVELVSDQTLPMQRCDDGWCELALPGAGPGTRYRFRIDGEIEVPDPASRFQPDDVHGPSEVIDPAYAWQSRRLEGPALARMRVPRSCTSAPSRPQRTFRGIDRKARPYRRDRHHRDRADAGRGLSRPLELGLRRRAAVRARRDLRPPGRSQGADRRRASARPDDVSRRRLQSLRARRKLSRPHRAAVLHAGRHALGQRDRLPASDGAQLRGRERAALARRIPLRRAAARRRPRHRRAGTHDVSRGAEPARRRTRRADRPPHPSRAGERRQPGEPARSAGRSAARPIPRAMERRLSPRLSRPAHRRSRGLLRRLSRRVQPRRADAGRRALPIRASPRPTATTQPRGEPTSALAPPSFVNFLQNHDQIGNRALRRAADRARRRRLRFEAALAVTLLAPGPPLLFMGDEWGAREPFPFFCDFKGDLAQAVREGRRREFAEAYAQHARRARSTLARNRQACFARLERDRASRARRAS